MSMEICNLGSGSSGNCTVVRIDGRVLLIDVGFGPRVTAEKLGDIGLSLEHIDAILLTHLDTDHFKKTWLNTMLQHRIAVYCHRKHLVLMYKRVPRTNELHDAKLLFTFDDEPFGVAINGSVTARVESFHLAHDQVGSVGYRIEYNKSKLGYATDLGKPTSQLIEAMTDVDVLAIESNYDPEMQSASTRPATLKQRITNGKGHLSNQQAIKAIRTAVDRSTCPPKHIILLHLSRQCNDPGLVRDLYAEHNDLADRLCITDQNNRTDWMGLHQHNKSSTSHEDVISK